MSEVRPHRRVGTMPRDAVGGFRVSDSAASQASPASVSAAPSQPWPSPRQAWYGVTIFALTVMTLFGSQGLMGLLMQSIKVDLGLTDTEVSLLVGFAAAAFNALASLPIS